MSTGSDKFSQALTLMREAFDDAAVGAMFVPGADLAAEVDAAQKVINQCRVRGAGVAGRSVRRAS